MLGQQDLPGDRVRDDRRDLRAQRRRGQGTGQDRPQSARGGERAGPVPSASTLPAPAGAAAATEGTRRAASRGGSMWTTASPAAIVNALIMASVSTAAIRVRRTMTYHLARGRPGITGQWS